MSLKTISLKGVTETTFEDLGKKITYKRLYDTQPEIAETKFMGVWLNETPECKAVVTDLYVSVPTSEAIEFMKNFFGDKYDEDLIDVRRTHDLRYDFRQEYKLKIKSQIDLGSMPYSNLYSVDEIMKNQDNNVKLIAEPFVNITNSFAGDSCLRLYLGFYIPGVGMFRKWTKYANLRHTSSINDFKWTEFLSLLTDFEEKYHNYQLETFEETSFIEHIKSLSKNTREFVEQDLGRRKLKTKAEFFTWAANIMQSLPTNSADMVDRFETMCIDYLSNKKKVGEKSNGERAAA